MIMSNKHDKEVKNKVVAPNLGLKRMTKPGSSMQKTSAGGNGLEHDTSKPARKYLVTGEKGYKIGGARWTQKKLQCGR